MGPYIYIYIYTYTELVLICIQIFVFSQFDESIQLDEASTSEDADPTDGAPC